MIYTAGCLGNYVKFRGSFFCVLLEHIGAPRASGHLLYSSITPFVNQLALRSKTLQKLWTRFFTKTMLPCRRVMGTWCSRWQIPAISFSSLFGFIENVDENGVSYLIKAACFINKLKNYQHERAGQMDKFWILTKIQNIILFILILVLLSVSFPNLFSAAT